MQHSNLSADELLNEAKSSAKEQDTQASRDYLRQYLLREHALSWLARVSADTNEALTAAELALCLNPSDEVAQRALASVGHRNNGSLDRRPARHELSANISLVTGMTLAQARATIWPFEGGTRTIGDLLDSGAKSLKDLMWAYTATNKSQVRDACKTIMLSHLLDVEPAQPLRPLRLISGSRYSEEQERRALAMATMFAGALLMLSVLFVLFGIAGFAVAMPTALKLSFYPLALLAWWGSRQMERYERRMVAFRVGRWGEEKIVKQLRAMLDSRWTLFRNFVYPGRKGGDVDLILVGPAGVWVFEVKTYAGLVRNVGDTWERKTKKGWKALEVNPGHQARTNAAELKRFLDAHDAKVSWVEAVVLWASSEAADADQRGTISLESPKTPVWATDNLVPQIEDLAQRAAKLDEAQVARMVELLQSTLASAVQARR